jgi:hypothetical protein
MLSKSSGMSAEALPEAATSDHIMLVRTCLMRAVDIGHSAKAWSQHIKWSYRIQEEFHRQGDAEHTLGLPLGPLNSRENFDMAKSQIGFLQIVALPIWKEFSRLDKRRHGGTGFTRVYFACRANEKQWHLLKQEATQTMDVPGSICADAAATASEWLPISSDKQVPHPPPSTRSSLPCQHVSPPPPWTKEAWQQEQENVNH